MTPTTPVLARSDLPRQRIRDVVDPEDLVDSDDPLDDGLDDFVNSLDTAVRELTADSAQSRQRYRPAFHREQLIRRIMEICAAGLETDRWMFREQRLEIIRIILDEAAQTLLAKGLIRRAGDFVPRDLSRSIERLIRA